MHLLPLVVYTCVTTKYGTCMTKSVTKSSRAEISNCIVSYFYLCVFSEVHVFLCYFVCVYQQVCCLSLKETCLLSLRYLLWTLPSTYSPLDYRTFNQTQFMSLRCAAKMLEVASTGATGVPTLPREHQRTVSFMTASSGYFH